MADMAAMHIRDAHCSICLEILFEPVRLPCDHTLCKTCLQRSIAENTVSCPICRKRIATFCRKAKSSTKDELIDRQLWEKIQRDFPDLVEKRRLSFGTDDFSVVLEGNQGDALDDIFPCVPTHDHASPGDIGKELERLEEAQRQEQVLRQQQEEEQSAKLIEQLVAEQDAERVPQAIPASVKQPQSVLVSKQSKIAPSGAGSIDRFVRRSVEREAAVASALTTDTDDSFNLPDLEMTPELVRAQSEELSRLEQLKRDASLARQLQMLESRQDPLVTRSAASTRPTPYARPEKKSTPSASQGKSPSAKMKQLSIFDSMKSKGDK